MGVREIRYCDVSGSERNVESHVVHVDQMRIEIDLAGPEYEKLLKLLRPYLDAGRVEASVPNAPGRVPKRSTSTALTVEQRQQVRDWAAEKGIEVPSNNRFKGSIVAAWRKDMAELAGVPYEESDIDDEDDEDDDEEYGQGHLV